MDALYTKTDIVNSLPASQVMVERVLDFLELKPISSKEHGGKIVYYYSFSDFEKIKKIISLPLKERIPLLRTKDPHYFSNKLTKEEKSNKVQNKLQCRDSWNIAILSKKLGIGKKGFKTLLLLKGFDSFEEFKNSNISLQELENFYKSLPGNNPQEKGRYLFSKRSELTHFQTKGNSKRKQTYINNIQIGKDGSWLTNQEAAEILNRNNTTTYRLYKDAGYPIKRVGQASFFQKDCIQTLKDSFEHSKNRSKIDLCFQENLKNNNIDFLLEYHTKGYLSEKGYPLRFDYFIPNKNLLIEVQGDQHFYDNWKGCKESWKNSDTESIQQRDNLKIVWAQENNIEIIWLTDYSDIQDIVNYIKGEELSVPLKCWLHRGHFPYESSGTLLKRFHKSYWRAHLKGQPSPYDCWCKRKKDFLKLVENRMKYSQAKNIETSPTKGNILAGFQLAHICPAVSFFPVKRAEDILKEYCTQPNIIDPFSGFSGRMVASLNLGKTYTGFDINEDHIKESKEYLMYFKASANLEVKDLFDTEKSSYQDSTLFTCPPYSDKEIWGKESIFLSCDDWILEVLKRYDCNEYIFVVDETNLFKVFSKPLIRKTSSNNFGKGSALIIYFTRDSIKKQFNLI